LAPTPVSQASGIAAARAASRAVKVASVPPDVSVPPLPAAQPTISLIQRTSWCSMMVVGGAISCTAVELLKALISASIQMAAGSGAETWWPRYIGWVRRVTSGRISRSMRPSTSLSGRPVAGSGSLNRAASSSGMSLVETGPSPLEVSAR
jgi:hypothetical protein